MALDPNDPVARVRMETTLSTVLISDDQIQAFVDFYTVDGVWDFEMTVGQVFAYLSAQAMADTPGGTLKMWQRGPVRVEFAETWFDRAWWWRNRSATGSNRIIMDTLAREDFPARWPSETAPEYPHSSPEVHLVPGA